MGKRTLTVLLAVLAAMGLTTAAFADAIGPGEWIAQEAGGFLPWLLVIVVVVVTILLLRRRKK